jgi:hypothetical protein
VLVNPWRLDFLIRNQISIPTASIASARGIGRVNAVNWTGINVETVGRLDIMLETVGRWRRLV